MPSGTGSAPLWLAPHLWAGLGTEDAGTGAGWKGRDCFLGTGLSLRSLSWHKPACSGQVLTFCSASWIMRWTSSGDTSAVLFTIVACWKRPLENACSEKKAGSCEDRKEGTIAWRKVKGRSPRGTHHTESMGTYPKVQLLEPTDVWVSICLAAQHARWRGESKSGEYGAGPAVPEGCPQGSVLCLPCWTRGRTGGCAGEGGIAGQPVPAGSHGPSGAPLAKEQRGPGRGGWGVPAHRVCPLSHRQSPNTPLPGDGELCVGMLDSHLAPSRRGPPASLSTWRTSTASTCRVLLRQRWAFSSAHSSANSEGEAGQG